MSKDVVSCSTVCTLFKPVTAIMKTQCCKGSLARMSGEVYRLQACQFPTLSGGCSIIDLDAMWVVDFSCVPLQHTVHMVEALNKFTAFC